MGRLVAPKQSVGCSHLTKLVRGCQHSVEPKYQTSGFAQAMACYPTDQNLETLCLNEQDCRFVLGSPVGSGDDRLARVAAEGVVDSANCDAPGTWGLPSRTDAPRG